MRLSRFVLIVPVLSFFLMVSCDHPTQPGNQQVYYSSGISEKPATGIGSQPPALIQENPGALFNEHLMTGISGSGSNGVHCLTDLPNHEFDSLLTTVDQSGLIVSKNTCTEFQAKDQRGKTVCNVKLLDGCTVKITYDDFFYTLDTTINICQSPLERGLQ